MELLQKLLSYSFFSEELFVENLISHKIKYGKMVFNIPHFDELCASLGFY